jgi:hypothetical protein
MTLMEPEGHLEMTANESWIAVWIVGGQTAVLVEIEYPRLREAPLRERRTSSA